MKIILSNVIIIEQPIQDIISWAKKELVFKNPDYEKKKRMGYYVYGTPKEIKLYDLVDDKLYIPMGMFEKLWKKHPVLNDYVDYTITRPVKIKSNIKLRDYQEPSVRAVREHCMGVLGLKVGTGKTQCALQSIAEMGQKTLFMAHTRDLVNQAKERCESNMECKTSLVMDGKLDISGDIVFGTIQTIYKFIENGELKQNDFGMVVLDECQHISANPSSLQMFRTVIEYFAAKYKIGLSAELHRSDGLQNCIKAILGDIIYDMQRDENDYVCIYENKELIRFPVEKFQVPCHIKVINTEYNVWDKNVFSSNGGTIEFASLISDLAKDETRNKQIISDLRKVEGSTIVLGDRVEHLKYLCSQVENGVEIDGSTSKKKREQAIQDVRDGKVKYLFASYSLAKEGLDCPILSNLFLASPVKDFGIVVQSIGRIQRPYGDKKISYVYDYVDNVGMLLRFYTKRRAIYRKNKWTIDNIYA